MSGRRVKALIKDFMDRHGRPPSFADEWHQSERRALKKRWLASGRMTAAKRLQALHEKATALEVLRLKRAKGRGRWSGSRGRAPNRSAA